MLIIAKTLDEVISKHERIVGFWGAPPRDMLFKASAERKAGLLDLDVDLGAPKTGLVPDAYCHIIRNCVDNAVALGQRLVHVVAATGKEKCDAGRYAAWLLSRILNATVEATEITDSEEPKPPLLCEALGPLKQRVIAIMRSIARPLEQKTPATNATSRCEPTHGFWGTPPHPIELLDLFPDTTHIFGWTRCVEQERPADLVLETTVPADLPIVFFSQGFCAKAMLAKHLAEMHRGMHVDAHDAVNAATIAKIEAFIRLSKKGSNS